MPHTLSHMLAIGGTGMLADAVCWLAEQGHEVTVVGRNQHKLQRLTDRHPSLHPVTADYKELERFVSVLKEAVVQRGYFTRVLAWIHDREETIFKRLYTELFSDPSCHWELFHVLGSASNLEEIEKKVNPPPNCKYHQIKLGFALEGNHSRWLTHKEISAGAIDAMKTGREVTIVGTLTLWSKRTYLWLDFQ